jgi:hypothetical protein
VSRDPKPPPPRQGASPESVMTEELGRWLGPLTARAAVRLAAIRTLNVSAERVTPADVPKVLESLRPMLDTLLGGEHAARVIDDVARRFSP